jgi:hypothetical protein
LGFLHLLVDLLRSQSLRPQKYALCNSA